MAKSQNRSIKNEKEKKKLQKRQEKEQRKEERKGQSKDGNSLDAMMAYVDEYGNITSTPPDPTKKFTIKADDIVIGVPTQDPSSRNPARKGVVLFFNASKGYGFIKDSMTGESVFVHSNGLASPLDKDDTVEFETQRTPRGLAAINVQKK